jgi:hypothetical protein
MVELKEKSIPNASLAELNYTSNNVGISNGILGGLVDVEAVVKLEERHRLRSLSIALLMVCLFSLLSYFHAHSMLIYCSSS